MKAWSFDRYGTPDVLALVERAIPVPRRGEALVRVVATAVNPSDVKNVSGHFKSALPRVPGRDFAGVVVGGDGPLGAEIWGSGPGWGVGVDGAHTEYVVVPADCISRRPATLTVDEAASVGVPYLAAWASLITEGKLEAGETVLVTGVSGAVGRAATQIAHWKGARVLGASISLDNPSGADAMIDTSKQNLAAEARALTGGRGVDLVLDAVGGVLFEPCLASLRHGGRQVAIASNPQVVSFNLVDFYHGLKRLLAVDTMSLTGPDIVGVLDHLRSGFEEGALVPPPVRTWSFEDAPKAYDEVRTGGDGRKQVLRLVP
jgi:NADPH:quinone reductase-like Zn-dependent oxidoreductase